MRAHDLPRVGRRRYRHSRKWWRREDFVEEATDGENLVIGAGDERSERITEFGTARAVPFFEEPRQGQMFVQADCVAFVAENDQERVERQDTISCGLSHGPVKAARRPAPTWQWRR